MNLTKRPAYRNSVQFDSMHRIRSMYMPLKKMHTHVYIYIYTYIRGCYSKHHIFEYRVDINMNSCVLMQPHAPAQVKNMRMIKAQARAAIAEIKKQGA